MLYHWAIEEYRRNFFLTIVTIAQSFSKNNTFSKNNIKNHQISLMAFRYTFKTAYTSHLSFYFCEHNHFLLISQYFRSSPRPISNSQLHALRHFHPCPIYLVVFKGSYFLKNGISHLEGGFTLRCLQRLSLPDLATRPWTWRFNRYTRGQSIPVLSY